MMSTLPSLLLPFLEDVPVSAISWCGVVCLVRVKNTLLGLGDAIQLQSEALRERYQQQRVNAKVLTAKVINDTSHIHKCGTTDWLHSLCIQSCPFWVNLPTQVHPQEPVGYLDQNLALFLPVSISLSLCSPCVS